ncbi:MAG: hypothetical protein ACTSU2_05790 [Promethearchaeota archaeon]
MQIDEIFSNSLSFLSNSKQNLRKELFSDFHLKPFREIYLAQKAEEDPVLLKAFRTDLTPVFYDHLRYVVSKCSGVENESDHITFVVIGEQGSGKSVLAMKIALLYKRLHKELWDREIRIYFTFSDAESLAKISELEDFSIIIQDENPKISGIGSRSAISALGNLLEEGRFAGRSFIKCAPHREMIPGCNYYLRPAGFYSNDNEVYLRVLVFQSEDEGSKLKPTGFFIVEVASAFAYMKKSNYNKLKEENFRKLTDAMGSESAITENRVKKLKEYAKKLYTQALKLGWKGQKKDLQAYLSLIDIAVSTAEAKTIIVLAHNMNKEAEKQKEQEEQKQKEKQQEKYAKLREFDAEKLEQEILNDMLKTSKSSTIRRDIEIYNVSKTLQTLDQIAEKYNLSPARIKQIVSKISEYIDRKMGLVYEEFFKNFLIQKNIYDNVERFGGISEPDIVCKKGNEHIIYSVKCLSFSRKSFSISYTEFKPEIRYAERLHNEGKEVNVIIHIYNRFNKKIYEKELEKEYIKNHVPDSIIKRKTFLINL